MIQTISFDDEDSLPVSVIVPLSPNRRKFFESFVLPLIEANMVNEIIINDNFGTAPKKRNDGLKKSNKNNKYVMFIDDDILLPKDYIRNGINAIEKAQSNGENVGFAYCGYKGIVFYPNSHPMKGNFDIPTLPFNIENLKKGNYISTMSLICRSCFGEIRFDENLKRLQDWDLFLGAVLREEGCTGISIPGNEFLAFYLDEGITSNGNNEREAFMTVLQKHKLI